MQYAPELSPTNTFSVTADALISIRLTPSDDSILHSGVDAAVIALTERMIVPLKLEVGVTTKFPVDVEVGLVSPVAVIPARDQPPKATVTLPAVRPVIVYAIR